MNGITKFGVLAAAIITGSAFFSYFSEEKTREPIEITIDKPQKTAVQEPTKILAKQTTSSPVLLQSKADSQPESSTVKQEKSSVKAAAEPAEGSSEQALQHEDFSSNVPVKGTAVLSAHSSSMRNDRIPKRIRGG